MFSTILSRVLSAPDSPTADLYFRNACGDLLDGQVEEIAPTVFASSSACLVMRHAMRAPRLPSRRRLIYLIDDDVDAGTTDDTLPFLYRQKLRMVEQPAGRRLGRFAGVAVVSSPVLARLFMPLLQTHMLRPYWSDPFAALTHFDQLDNDWIEMAYLGSSVHRSDLRFLAPIVVRLLDQFPQLRFHLPERHRLPLGLDRHPRVHPIRGLGWTAYRRAISGRQFHLALYPLMDTPFNRARSVNKLIEHAVVGAAPVYSSTWHEGLKARDAGAGLAVPNDPEAWFQSVCRLIIDKAEMRALAHGARALAHKLNQAEPQRRLWRDLLGVGASVPA